MLDTYEHVERDFFNVEYQDGFGTWRVRHNGEGLDLASAYTLVRVTPIRTGPLRIVHVNQHVFTQTNIVREFHPNA